jgi:hypothetical protein
LLLALSIGAGWDNLHAAQVKALPQQGGYVLSITGTIQSGDAERLARTFARVTRIKEIRLASRGGDVVEAVLMGEVIRAMRLHTVVATNETCASACFFLWLNGSRRLANHGLGRLGLHSPFLQNPSNTEGSRTAQANLANAVTGYLEDRRVPRKFIDLMMSRPSSQFYWLSGADLLEIGTTPPELEELYLAQCHGSVGGLTARRRAAQRAHDAGTMKEIDARMSGLVQCRSRLDDEVRAATVQELRNGWRPPPPFQPGR